MYPLLFTISFILHLVSISWILFLAMKIKQSQDAEKRQVEIQQEIEDVMKAYILEMKEENEKLITTIEKMTSKQKNETISQSQSVTKKNDRKKEKVLVTPTYNKHLNNQKIVLQKEEERKQHSDSTLLTSVEDGKEYIPPLLENEDQFVQTLESQVLLLLKKGYTAEEIAKKLNKGITEIDLIIKFHT